MTATVTAVLPTYRRPRLLARAVRSVLAQSHQDLEVRIYDNASGDDTSEVVCRLAKSDPRVTYFCHEQNIGALNNFNFGLKRVATPFFALLSDDDVIFPDFYARAVAELRANPAAMFCATGVLHMDEGGSIYPSPEMHWEEGLHHPPAGLFAMLDKGHPTWTGIVFRREVIEDLGGLDPATGAASDLDFELRAASKFAFVFQKQPGGIFMCHPESLSAQGRLDMTWPGWLRMRDNISQESALSAANRAAAASLVERKLRKRLRDIALGGISRGNLDDSIRACDILQEYFHDQSAAAPIRALAGLAKLFPQIIYLSSVFKCLWRRWRCVSKTAPSDALFSRLLEVQ